MNLSETEKERIKIKSELVLSTKAFPKNKPGGQSAGITIHPITASHEALGIRISVNYFRSNYKNKEFAKRLFNLAVDELIK